MKKRFAVVMWWVGCVFAAMWLVTGVVAAFEHIKDAMIILMMAPLTWAFFAAICFVVSGSFLRPPPFDKT